MRAKIERIANACHNFELTHDKILLGYLLPGAIELDLQVLEEAILAHRQLADAGTPGGRAQDHAR